MIIGYIVGALLGGWLALWFIWEILKILVKAIFYLTHRKQIKKEKMMEKKEKELNEWHREQRIKQMEATKKALEEQEAWENEEGLIDDETHSDKEEPRKASAHLKKILEERGNGRIRAKD